MLGYDDGQAVSCDLIPTPFLSSLMMGLTLVSTTTMPSSFAAMTLNLMDLIVHMLSEESGILNYSPSKNKRKEVTVESLP